MSEKVSPSAWRIIGISNDSVAHFLVGKIIYCVGNFGWWVDLIYRGRKETLMERLLPPPFNLLFLPVHHLHYCKTWGRWRYTKIIKKTKQNETKTKTYINKNKTNFKRLKLMCLSMYWFSGWRHCVRTYEYMSLASKHQHTSETSNTHSI